MLPLAEIVGEVGPVTLSVHSVGGGGGASGDEAARSGASLLPPLPSSRAPNPQRLCIGRFSF